jgi:hypothetical protein
VGDAGNLHENSFLICTTPLSLDCGLDEHKPNANESGRVKEQLSREHQRKNRSFWASEFKLYAGFGIGCKIPHHAKTQNSLFLLFYL